MAGGEPENVQRHRLSGVDGFELFDRQEKIDAFDSEFGQDQFIDLLWPLGIYEGLERIQKNRPRTRNGHSSYMVVRAADVDSKQRRRLFIFNNSASI